MSSADSPVYSVTLDVIVVPSSFVVEVTINVEAVVTADVIVIVFATIVVVAMVIAVVVAVVIAVIVVELVVVTMVLTVVVTVTTPSNGVSTAFTCLCSSSSISMCWVHVSKPFISTLISAEKGNPTKCKIGD